MKDLNFLGWMAFAAAFILSTISLATNQDIPVFAYVLFITYVIFSAASAIIQELKPLLEKISKK